jgi:hypothetical protein
MAEVPVNGAQIVEGPRLAEPGAGVGTDGQRAFGVFDGVLVAAKPLVRQAQT